MNTCLSLGLHHWWKRRAVSRAAVSNGYKVLDLCTGTGDLAMLLAQKVGDEGKVFAVDFCLEMLEVARERAGRSHLKERIRFVEAEATCLPFKDSSFDVVTIGYGIRNIPNRRKAFAEMLRLLKPGGRVICLEFSKPVLLAIRNIYSFYLSRLVPAVGNMLTKGKAYSYLSNSIKAFPDQEELREIMEAAGLKSIQYFNLSGGISAIHIGLK